MMRTRIEETPKKRGATRETSGLIYEIERVQQWSVKEVAFWHELRGSPGNRVSLYSAIKTL
jgi:hypothetical protein